MPKGNKSKYTAKQKRQAEHIEEGYEKRGVGKKTAESRAWRTVNKTSGGGKKGGSATKKKASAKKSAPRRGRPKSTRRKAAKARG
jgi:plasmid stabilization system protein ParE